MEERIARLEQGRKDLENRLDKEGKEKASEGHSNVEEHDGTTSHVKGQTETMNPEKRMYINIAASGAHPAGTSAHQPIDLGDNFEHEVPDLSMMDEVEKRIKGDMKKAYEEKFRCLEEKLRAIQGEGNQGNDASELSLVTDLVLPPKFQAPDFDKYYGTTCPSAHITMYCRKMVAFIKEEKLLIHYFQDSLTGSATRWYTQLSPLNIKTWKDLSRAFVEQYKHVFDMTPNRIMLEGMDQKANESLRQYAQRWRDVAAQIQPPIPEYEITPLFVNTLRGALFDRLINNTTQAFADIVRTGESIEVAIKSGRIDAGESAKRTFKKKDSEVNTTSSYNLSKNFTISPPVASGSEQGGAKKETKPPKKDNEKMAFTPLPISYAELYTQLYKADLKVAQNLIKAGVLKFDNPNVAANHLPNHGGRGVNAIDEDCVRKTKNRISEVTTPLRWVFQRLCMARLIDRDMVIVHEGSRPYCEYHQEEGHDIQLCEEFRHLVQSMMDNKEIEFFEKVDEGRNSYVCASEGHKIKYGVDRPLVISLKPKEETPPQDGLQGVLKLVISAPTPFLFRSTKQVPWNYTAHVSIQGEEETQNVEKSHEEAQPKRKEGPSEKEVVSEVGHFTRSGRCYSPETAKAPKTTEDKGKTVAVEPEKIFGEEPPPKINEPVTETQAPEFLKFLKHSEYSIVEQLHKQQARISILELLLCSEKHREALLKILNQTFVPDNISIEKLDLIVGNIAANNYITFSDDEIPKGGMGSTKALNITTHCKGYVLLGVLIDNGSTLNVMPLATLQRFPVDSSHIKPCQNSVRAFDGTQRETIEKIEIPLLIGPAEYTVEFVVMDIKPTYNCLLGRPWIHSAGAVPSSLHQKLKFVIEGKLVCAEAEQDIIATVTSDTPYVETNEEAVECAF
ncbi:hypothetical protein V6N12_042897 [Hibiscus sabdariffa]|uniref:Retrotransposon gag domain-containing protein n=1 Tax=Hibiscus sabdariffa TaxID=183260 RepID=A0ABR2BFB6_9ROSI